MSVKRAQDSMRAALAARDHATSGGPYDVEVVHGDVRVPWPRREEAFVRRDGLREEDVGPDAWVDVFEQGKKVAAGKAGHLKELLGLTPRVLYDADDPEETGVVPFGDLLPGLVVTRLPKPRYFASRGEERLWLRAVRERTVTASLAYADGSGVVVAVAETSYTKALGVSLDAGASKLEKRLKPLLTAYRFGGYTPGLGVKVLEGVPDVEEALYDGGFALRESVARRVIAASPDSQVKRLCADCMIYSGRLFIQEGLLKGHAYLVPDAVMDHLHGPGVDVVTHPVNIKREVSGYPASWLALTPKLKKRGVRTNVQAMLALPQLFREADVKAWADAHFYRIYHGIKKGEALEDYVDLYQVCEEAADEDEALDSSLLWFRQRAVQFVKHGFHFLNSPTLTRRTFEAHAAGLSRRTDFQAKVTVPVPCALMQPVICETLANLCGMAVDVKDGDILPVPAYGCHVVGDGCWNEMLPSHGGCDQDDDFSLFYRLIDGKKRVVVMRSPCDVGEYSVFAYKIDDEGPETELVAANGDRRTVHFPAADLTDAPRRVSELLEEGMLTLTPPLEEAEDDAGEEDSLPARYGTAHVARAARRSLEGLSPGLYVNAKMLRNYTFGSQPAALAFTMEQAVDACTQGGKVRTILAARAEACGWVEEVICSGKPVDRELWRTRAPGWVEQTPLLEDGWLTRLLAHVEDRKAKCAAKLEAWVQDNVAAPVNVTAVPMTKGGELFRRISNAVKLWNVHIQQAMKLPDHTDAQRLAKKLACRAVHEHFLAAAGPENVGPLAWYLFNPPSRCVGVKDTCLWNAVVFPHYLKFLAAK